MTSLDRPLSGDALLFDLAAEIQSAREAHSSARTGRTGRTLLKAGPLRVTLIVLDADNEIAEHSAEGPITIHVLSGVIHVDIAGQDHTVRAGQMLAAGPGVRHAVRAAEDSAFLLTVALPD